MIDDQIIECLSITQWRVDEVCRVAGLKGRGGGASAGGGS